MCVRACVSEGACVHESACTRVHVCIRVHVCTRVHPCVRVTPLCAQAAGTHRIGATLQCYTLPPDLIPEVEQLVLDLRRYRRIRTVCKANIYHVTPCVVHRTLLVWHNVMTMQRCYNIRYSDPEADLVCTLLSAASALRCPCDQHIHASVDFNRIRIRMHAHVRVQMHSAHETRAHSPNCARRMHACMATDA